jgi:hypothetical protein
MQDELAARATVRRGIEGVIFGAKAGAGATDTRLGRLVFGLRESRAEPTAELFAAIRGAWRPVPCGASGRRLLGMQDLARSAPPSSSDGASPDPAGNAECGWPLTGPRRLRFRVVLL